MASYLVSCQHYRKHCKSCAHRVHRIFQPKIERVTVFCRPPGDCKHLYPEDANYEVTTEIPL